ncbi:MAG: aminodeoxychorismate synthase component I [Armatimonadota bacterium]|nr:aminodeoxychorismate synthase component I [Armatimonadota bacterium]
MRYVEFDCAPSVNELMEHIEYLPDRFIIEDVGSGRAVIGAQPFLKLTSKDGITVCDQAGTQTILPGDPFEVLSNTLKQFACEPIRGIPFAGGAVGYLAYDLGRAIEHLPTLAVEDVSTPDYCLGFYDSALIVDLPRRLCIAVSQSGDKDALRFWYDLAKASDHSGKPAHPDLDIVNSPDRLLHTISRRTGELRSNFTKTEYLHAVERVKEYIAAGDCYQVNLSQRFDTELTVPPWELYKTLRRINPAPHSCFMQMGEPILASASPESFLSYDPVTRTVTTRPIKGTRPRGSTPEEDARLAEELASSEKDRAENVMIVDMERNDLGRVARYGTVRVPELWRIEAHPNVFQMVSTVQAELAEDKDAVDLLRASFPGGSITGAPKVRAMEIIEEIEPHRRGIYTGSAGFIDFTGRVELSIVIRSFVVQAGRVYFHAGGGIVADSDPEMEYEETLHKVSGLVATLEECGCKSGSRM